MKTNHKKAFSLVEILVSIALFSIIVLFLYQSLDITQKSNKFYSSKLDDKKTQNSLKKILFLDLMHLEGNVTTILDKEKNSIVQLKTTNLYHNPFYQHITYFVSKEKNLIRIESKNVFNSSKVSDSFLSTSYIDILDSNISKFRAEKQVNKKTTFYILKENKEKIIFSF